MIYSWGALYRWLVPGKNCHDFVRKCWNCLRSLAKYCDNCLINQLWWGQSIYGRILTWFQEPANSWAPFVVYWKGCSTLCTSKPLDIKNSGTTIMNSTDVLNHRQMDECDGIILPDSELSLPPEHPIRYLEGIGYPFFFVFGTAGNVLNLLILRRNKHRSAADVFVMSMAITDLFIM